MLQFLQYTKSNPYYVFIYYFFHENDYINKKRTKIMLRNVFNKTSFSNKSKEPREHVC